MCFLPHVLDISTYEVPLQRYNLYTNNSKKLLWCCHVNTTVKGGCVLRVSEFPEFTLVAYLCILHYSFPIHWKRTPLFLSCQRGNIVVFIIHNIKSVAPQRLDLGKKVQHLTLENMICNNVPSLYFFIFCQITVLLPRTYETLSIIKSS